MLNKSADSIVKTFDILNEVLDSNRCKSVQVLSSRLTHNGKCYFVAHVVFESRMREKVLTLIDDTFHGDIYPVRAGKTFVDYAVAEREA